MPQGPPTARPPAAWVRELATVVDHGPGGCNWFRLRLRAPRIAASALPGQFAQIRVEPVADPACDAAALPPAVPLLRRPLSFCTAEPAIGEVSFVYRVVGTGTAALATARSGQRLDLLGPLGRPLPDPAASTGQVVLVGGGLGIAPLACAAERVLACGRPATAILGAATADLLAGADEVVATGVPAEILTEDGSRGAVGIVTQALHVLLRGAGRREVWACGPAAMLEAVRSECAARDTPCWLLVETPMACGFGVCLGCAVPRGDGGGYLRACVDGPAFAAGEVGAIA